MERLKAQQVFTPGAFPKHTYVQRSERQFEEQLADGIDTPGMIVSLSGPSKSGKTVLVERVVGVDNLITVTGAGIGKPEEVWDRVLDWMESPSETSRSVTFEGKSFVEGEARGEAKLPFVAKAAVSGRGGLEGGVGTTGTKVYRRRGLAQVVAEIAHSDFVVLVDDFHYMARVIQEGVAKQLKEAVRQGVKIVTAAVPHRSDDVVRANPELRGRVLAVDLDYWSEENLIRIAELGFNKLNVSVDRDALRAFASEAAGSPQLMQAVCLNACLEMRLREPQTVSQQFALDSDTRRAVLERTALASDFRSLVDVLDHGPKTRGTDRKMYEFDDGGRGDVYRCVLKAVAADPPRLSFAYDELLGRARLICRGEPPVGSSMIGSCTHMARLAQEKFPKERVVDWDEQKFVLDLPDPYLLFYLRWSGRLMESDD